MTPDALAGLHAACFETPRPWSTKEFDELLNSPSVFLCTASDGFALGRILLDEAELLTIAVQPSRRRAGHGRQLLESYERKARSLGAVTSFLEVSAENCAAQALYESHGYQQTGRRKAYYRRPDGKRIDALLFSRSLVETST